MRPGHTASSLRIVLGIVGGVGCGGSGRTGEEQDCDHLQHQVMYGRLRGDGWAGAAGWAKG